jgi:hypothetical protein
VKDAGGPDGCRGVVAAGDRLASVWRRRRARISPRLWAFSCGPVPLLAALVVFDHPPSAFIFDEGWRVVKDRNGTRVVVVEVGGLWWGFWGWRVVMEIGTKVEIDDVMLYDCVDGGASYASRVGAKRRRGFGVAWGVEGDRRSAGGCGA